MIVREVLFVAFREKKLLADLHVVSDNWVQYGFRPKSINKGPFIDSGTLYRFGQKLPDFSQTATLEFGHPGPPQEKVLPIPECKVVLTESLSRLQTHPARIILSQSPRKDLSSILWHSILGPFSGNRIKSCCTAANQAVLERPTSNLLNIYALYSGSPLQSTCYSLKALLCAGLMVPTTLAVPSVLPAVFAYRGRAAAHFNYFSLYLKVFAAPRRGQQHQHVEGQGGNGRDQSSEPQEINFQDPEIAHPLANPNSTTVAAAEQHVQKLEKPVLPSNRSLVSGNADVFGNPNKNGMLGASPFKAMARAVTAATASPTAVTAFPPLVHRGFVYPGT
ncbi:hypothetical protein GGX14DRAFT_394511 [Mycena pura]|uniref:Uncharacterized protein n=1 Tax=Mycena pura TaxID=153505 RepID=A0AAD6YFR8_9AGAR|nr:hypothetical protein GGX14DRAFT_394511 [Mycena pura]